MKKKIISVLLVLAFLVVPVQPTSATTITKVNSMPDSTFSDHLSDNSNYQEENNSPYEYPIVPGTTEWDMLTMDEKIIVSYVDENVVKNMTTYAVLITTLNYPFIINIYAYDTIDEGIDVVKEYFPPLAELLAREDTSQVISLYIGTYDESNTTNSIDYYIANRIRQYVDSKSAVSPYYITDPITGEPAAQARTPKGSVVLVYDNLTWDNFTVTYSECYDYSIDAQTVYGATLLRNPSPAYNCHSYAWYSTSENNHYWMNNPERYILDGSYIPGTATVGNKITYKSSNGTYTHSGIMTSSGTVTSKWGPSGLLEHGVYSCPYYVAGVTINYWKLYYL